MPRTILPIVFTLSAVLTILLITQAGAQTRYTFQPIEVPFPDAQIFTVGGLNNAGVVMGRYEDGISELLGFQKIKGTYTMLPLMEPGHINNHGRFTGWYYSFDAQGMIQKGFLHTGTSLVPIHVQDAHGTTGSGINDHDDVVGSYFGLDGHHAFLYRDGVLTTIDPPFEGLSVYQATGINNAGQIVGGFAGQHGYLDDHGTFTQIDVPGARDTFPRDINNHGEICGGYCLPDGTCHGFTLINGVFTTVSVPGASFTIVAACNDRGQLAGTWFDTTNVHRGFLATPQPRQVGRR